MPQLNPLDWAPQIFWLILTFGVLYLLMVWVALPRIGGVIEKRANHIANDLAQADKLRRETEEAIAAYEQALAEAKQKAHAIVDDSRAKLKAKTDAEPLPDDPAALESRPEARNLIGIYGALSDATPRDVLAQYAGQGFGSFKPALAELLVETLRPIKARLDALNADPAELDRLLGAGARRATELAGATLAGAYSALGL